MRVILNRTSHEIEIHVHNGSEQVLLTISRRSVTHTRLQFDYARKHITIPFSEMRVYSRKATQRQWERKGRVKDCSITIYPRGRRQPDTDIEDN